MRKYKLLVGIITVSLVFGGCRNVNSSVKVTKSIDPTKVVKAGEKNNLKKPNIEEARDFKASLENGSVIMVSRDNSKELEVYNIDKLDKFIDAFNNKQEGYVRIIKGTLVDGKILVNKLEELESDSKSVKEIGYDCYSNKDAFTAVKPSYFPKVGRHETKDSLRYTLCPTVDTADGEGALLISFGKSSIKQ